MTASGLLAAIRRVTDAASQQNPVGRDGDDLLRLHRLQSDAIALARLELADLEPLSNSDRRRAESEAEHLAALLTQQDDRDVDLEVATVLISRLLRRVGFAGADRIARAVPALSARPAAEDDGLLRLADAYRGDAQRELRIMLALYAAAAILLLGALAVALVGLRDAQHDDGFRFDEFGAFALVALVPLLGAALAARRAMRHGVAAQESTRLRRQFSGLAPYLDPMPPVMRDLMRGTLAQQLFPRLLDDSEPWRETKWPAADELLATLVEPDDVPASDDQVGVADPDGDSASDSDSTDMR